jgi:hypothetical protein
MAWADALLTVNSYLFIFTPAVIQVGVFSKDVYTKCDKRFQAAFHGLPGQELFGNHHFSVSEV